MEVVLALAASLLGRVGPEDILDDRVDLIEVNHCYDEQGRLVFDQVIFYDFCPLAERFQVRAWRLIKDKRPALERDWERGGFTMLWEDNGQPRMVRSFMKRETWSQHDPEMEERLYVPPERRHQLRAPVLVMPRPQ